MSLTPDTAQVSAQVSDDEPSISINKSWINDFDENGMSSMDIIVDWVTTGQNYNSYTGTKAIIGEARTKDSWLKEIKELLVTNGHIEWNLPNIREKIRYLKSKFIEVQKMLNQSGFGTIPESPNRAATIKELVISKFKYYYTLEPIFCDRPSVSLAGVSTSEDALTDSSAMPSPRPLSPLSTFYSDISPAPLLCLCLLTHLVVALALLTQVPEGSDAYKRISKSLDRLERMIVDSDNDNDDNE
ncbi:hypothetical protein BC941DRAFT_457593 [Chlamydoabsidia padenii]|nr:hypothetical protein BC941DRAFT_457593 [Chlamydoabsidia padenii]